MAVWTADHLAAFLEGVVDDRLFPLWWLIALRGFRRCEACGLRWSEVDLDHGVLFVVRNRTTAGYQVVEGPPKTLASLRAVALDRHTVKILREHRRRQVRQGAERAAAGKAWRDTGYVFTCPDGTPLHPSYVSTRFRELVQRTDLPPVRLHDLRHDAASLAHEARKSAANPGAQRLVYSPYADGYRTGRYQTKDLSANAHSFTLKQFSLGSTYTWLVFTRHHGRWNYPATTDPTPPSTRPGSATTPATGCDGGSRLHQDGHDWHTARWLPSPVSHSA